MGLKRFQIFHSTRTRITGEYPRGGMTKAKARELLESGGYVSQATLLAKDLDDAYARSQNGHGPWFRNRGVTPHRQPLAKPRSTMVGDLILDESGTYWIVKGVGFDDLEMPAALL